MSAVRAAVAALAACAILSSGARMNAQGAGAAAATARATAPIDLTGNWVSFITEDWRYRMVTPPKGDYRNVPVTRAALAVLNAWNPAADAAAGEECRSYGAAAIMRVAGRIRVSWQDDDTLRIDTDAGMQTRLLRFAPLPAQRPARSWQGLSAARWETRVSGGTTAGGPPTRWGSLTVTTLNMRAGYLRKNGVPYSEDAALTEYFDVAPHPDGGQLLVVTSVVVDPRYLEQPFIVSSHFKKEADASGWAPTPCSASW